MATGEENSAPRTSKPVHWDRDNTGIVTTRGSRILLCKGQPVRRFVRSSDITQVTCKTCLKMFNAKLANVAKEIRADVLGVE